MTETMTDGAILAGAAAFAASRLPVVRGGQAPIRGAARSAGLSLRFDRGRFWIDVSDRAGTAAVSLGPYGDDDVVSVWRSLSATTGLPLLAGSPKGEADGPARPIGRVLVGPHADRSRLAVLSGRRPRFLVRRKTSRLPARPVVHREREIASGVGS